MTDQKKFGQIDCSCVDQEYYMPRRDYQSIQFDNSGVRQQYLLNYQRPNLCCSYQMRQSCCQNTCNSRVSMPMTVPIPMPMPMPTPYPMYTMPYVYHCCHEQSSNDEELLQECEWLRQRVKELEARKPEVKVVKESVTDDSRVESKKDIIIYKINALELENQQLRLKLNQFSDKLRYENFNLNSCKRQKDQEIFDLKNALQLQEAQKNDEINRLQLQIQELQNRIKFLEEELENEKKIIEQLDHEIQEWMEKYSALQSSSSTVVEEQVSYLNNEVNVWKQRFVQLNKEFHVAQEELIMAQAELESIKKGGTKEVKEVVVSKQTFTTSSAQSGSMIGMSPLKQL